MAFIHDSYETILNKNINEVTYNLLNGQVPLTNSNIRVQLTALSKAQFLQYGYLSFISLQATPYTATDEYLDYWGQLKNVARKSASQASGQITFTGTNGVSIPAQTILTSPDGENYTTDELAEVGTPVGITAVNAGSEGNQESGVTLTLQSSVAGVDSSVILTNAITQGSDTETDDAFRARVISAFSTQATGTTLQEHLNWIEAVPGVVEAWIPSAPIAGNEVVFYVMFDRTNTFGGYPQGTDGASQYEKRYKTATGDQLTIADQLYQNGKRPYSETQIICAPTRQNINFVINGLTSLSAADQADVKNAVQNVLHTQGTPLGTNITIASISSAIEKIVDDTSFTIASPTEAIILDIGSLPEIGTFTFGA